MCSGARCVGHRRNRAVSDPKKPNHAMPGTRYGLDVPSAPGSTLPQHRERASRQKLKKNGARKGYLFPFRHRAHPPT